MKTILKDRVLWYDGAVTFTADQLFNFILHGGVITPGVHVAALDSEIKQYNHLYPGNKLSIKKDLDHLNTTWNIPDKYKGINISKYVSSKFKTHLETKGIDFTEDEVMQRVDRVETELALYKEYEMEIILRTVIYIIDVYKQNGIVWGTGRGSSCSSYILYIIGLHSVDSVKWDVDMKEFFK